jgi:predicted aspartyl protease/phosphoribosylformylglycinamidine (FGAM) synthase PurS component
MLNFKTLLITTIAFVLGFALSEYRNIAATQAQVGLNKNSPISPSNLLEKSNEAELDTAKSARSNPIAADTKMPNAFSWAQVNQLIASERYADAIQLLETRMGNPKDAARAWLLAAVYKKQGYAIAAVDAWFRYLKLEVDSQKTEQARNDLQQYLVQLKANPALFNDDYAWLMAQFEDLLKYKANDGELHLEIATLLMGLKDEYQAQYHALMAVNDPLVQKRAEGILAKLNGEDTPAESVIPLVRYGNQYLVNTYIEGYPARLLLDTGASLSGLSTNYTGKYPALLKATKPIRLNTASGARDSVLFTVNQISIGKVVFNQHILAQLPMDNSIEFDGLLGVDILGRFDFVIDQNTATLKLKPRKQ